MDKSPDEINVFSMITGKTQEESKKIVEENKVFAEKLIDMVIYLQKENKNSIDLVSKITTIISVLLQPFPIDTRMALLSQVASVSLSGKSDDMMNIIKKVVINEVKNEDSKKSI